MATENQIKALEKWLGVFLMDMDFKMASAYLDRLHEANDEYKKDKSKKGVVKAAKGQIITELQELGLVVDEVVVKAGLQAGEKRAPHHTLADEGTQPEGNGATGIEDEIHKIAVVMRYAVREATAIVEQEINKGGIGEASKAGILQRIATTMFIEAERRGL